MKILVDETHNPRGRIFSNYAEFRNLLERNGHEIDIYDDFPIKLDPLREADVFIFPCCDGSKLYGYEIKTLLRYIEEGHGIFVLSHAGGDSGLRTNMSSLTTHFDIEIQSDQVFDQVHCDQDMPKQILIREFANHPITQGLEQICYVAGCSLKTGRKAKSMFFSDPDADPENAALIASWEGGKDKKGRVVVSGSYRMFSDYGIKKYQNAQLVLNICEWLANILEVPREEVPLVATTTSLTGLEVSTEPSTPRPVTSPEPALVSESAAKVEKLPRIEEIKQIDIVRPEDSSEIVIKLPVLKYLLNEVKLLRSDLEEIKDLLQRRIKK